MQEVETFEVVVSGLVHFLLLLRNQVVDRLSALQPLLHLDEQLDAVHHHLHQLHL